MINKIKTSVDYKEAVIKKEEYYKEIISLELKGEGKSELHDEKWYWYNHFEGFLSMVKEIENLPFKTISKSLIEEFLKLIKIDSDNLEKKKELTREDLCVTAPLIDGRRCALRFILTNF